MRFEITGRWKEGYEQDGLLYCAQRIEEMLMNYTSHLYKVPVYNSLLLCTEYLRIYDLVKVGTVDASHLSNIIEEFIDTFSSDIVIREHYSNTEIQHYISKLKSNSLPEQRKVMYYLFHIMGDYPIWAAETLKKSVGSPKDKKKIEKALRSYIPMLIGMGYHPIHIFRYCKQFFKNQDICDEACLDRLIEHFDGSDMDYTVYFAVDKRAIKFKSILESRLGISFETDELSEKLRVDHSKYTVINLHNAALDPNGAAIRAYNAFSIFMRFYKFLGNRDEDWCGDTALVKDPYGVVEYPPLKPGKYAISKDYDDKTLGKNSERIINKLLENAAGNDFFVIHKMIETHNTAIESHDAKNAFLNLWSIIEIIGVYDHTDSKIKEILRSIVPVLKRTYINRVAEELHDYIKANIDADEYSRIINSLNISGSEEFKIACLLILPEHDNKRKELYKALSHYPLIRSRMSQLHEDVFKDKKKYVAELNRYAQRLTWHIQRLYRVRNSIIHSGETDENIKSLVEHLHSYVDEVMLEIVDKLTQENSLGSIQNVLMDAQVYLENIEKEWKKSDTFTLEDIQKMFG